MRGMVMAVAVALTTVCSVAQVDEMLEGAWTQPALDVLERRREDPLCLRCCSAHDLTEIPGIGARTAARIVRAVDAGVVRSIESLADTLCLSPDQFLLLKGCTTLECSCTGIIRGVDARARLTEGGRGQVRADVTHRFGRAGILVAPGPATPVVGAWCGIDAGPVHVLVGDAALRVGSGLAVGSARGLARGSAGLLDPPSRMWSMRPWMSADHTGALRGVFVHADVPGTDVSVLAGVGSVITPGGPRPTRYAAATGTVLGVGVGVGYMESGPRSVSVHHDHGMGSTLADVVMDPDGHMSGQITTEWSTDVLDAAAAAWWYHPRSALELGAAVPGVFSTTNRVGMSVVVRYRPVPRYSIGLSILHGGHITRTRVDALPQRSSIITLDAQTRSASFGTASARVMYDRTEHGPAVVTVRVDAEPILASRWRARMRADLRSMVGSVPSTSIDGDGILLAAGLRYDVDRALSVHALWARFRSEVYDVAPRMLTPSVWGQVVPLVGMGSGTRRSVAVRWRITDALSVSGAVFDDRRVRDAAVRYDTGFSLQLDLRLRPAGRSGFIALNDETRTGLE